MEKINKFISKTESIVNIKYNLSLRSINEDLCLKVNKFINNYQQIQGKFFEVRDISSGP